MMHRLLKKKEVMYAAIAVVILYAFFYAAGIGCPIKYFTGISCAGCGMTRAWIAAAKLNFKEAMDYHPLFWTVPEALATWFYRRHIRRKIFNTLVFILIAAFIVVYIYRMFNGGNSIVVFEPWKSVPARIFDIIFN